MQQDGNGILKPYQVDNLTILTIDQQKAWDKLNHVTRDLPAGWFYIPYVPLILNVDDFRAEMLLNFPEQADEIK